MNNPFKAAVDAVEGIPQHFKDFVAAEVHQSELRVKLLVLQLLQKGNAGAAHFIDGEIEAQIEATQAELSE